MPVTIQRSSGAAADIALAGNDPCQVAAVVELSRHTLRVVRQNYTLSVGVNLAGLVAGAGGSINPVLAALPHDTSSIAAARPGTSIHLGLANPSTHELSSIWIWLSFSSS
ncbi:hypothetical protein PV963_07510 [Streptomyces coeruleorubidus]|uniref:hypothetical protein n=1 Tax=Streptomyces coeruleorubidus TaxID=116188 RepID=UPI00237F3016|nr:hypothetical protein [Streptomyces coeruleorubidus]WDV50221.1 hypothetical protein PV963_07510 [Streptomyces coeruleorubidus]